MNPSSILSKDRHYLYRLAQEIKNTHGDDQSAKQARYDEILNRSHAAFLKRQSAIPKNLDELLNHDLPVTKEADMLINAIKDNQVIIVAGETGSGKTTQLPKLAMLAGRGIAGQIGHTQPRRLAARSVASRIAEELGEPLGQTVSFKVRFTEEGGQHSIVKLMTDGILLAELGSDRFLTRYDTIIIDEAHERSLNIDFILGYLKSLLPKRPDLKVIITSATLDTERFANYFAKEGKPAPVFSVEGRSYPVEIRYRPLTDQIVLSHDDDAFDEIEDALPRALTAAVTECFDDAAKKGHPHQADILIFASTEAQIRELGEILTTHAPPHTEILPLFARQSFAEQQRIFHHTGKGRRIIIATNVAETALTVPNIRYVIDLGFARISRYNYRSRIQRLPIEAVSQAAANQRAGRCGRIGHGVCIRLYSEEDFYARLEFTEPEILRTNLASVILQMTQLNLGDVAEFDFITPPDFRLVNDGKKLLLELGAITDIPTKTAIKKRKSTPTKLTKIGQIMAKMPIDPRLARMLIAGNHFDCLADMLIIVSALAVQDVRERPINKQSQADQKHALFRREHSDFLFYLELYQALFGLHETNDHQLLSTNARRNFAKKHYLSFTRIREWQKTHEQLSSMMAELGFEIKPAQAELKASGNDSITKIDTKKGVRLSLDKNKKHKKSKQASLSALKGISKQGIPDQTALDYSNIHRALLTALLSFVAHKTDVMGEYLMARSQKARIFPASTLHKKGVDWLMAFEVVETSQVYMRCNAKIEPEWIVVAADGLLKYHYFEPHWSKKVGRVRAYMQISLFGLVIVAKELTNYEPVDIEHAREIFIRDALVGDNYGFNAKFLSHNTAKIKDVERIEDKLRRRDLLVDEERLYQFYDEKIPKHIASRKAFEEFYHEKANDDPNYLFFGDDDVLTQSIDTNQDFPETWQMGTIKLPLSYVFDPNSDDDGVTVRVPIKALSQIDSVALLWGIAGWRYELVLQLLKTLPKELRRQIVPIPDTTDKIFDQLNADGRTGLLDQICQNLLRLGVRVVPADFDPSKVDNYLRPLICVVDDKNHVIEKSRDLARLKARHTTTIRQEVMVEEGLHHDFPEHFNFVRNKHSAGVVMQEFSALKADKTGVAVSIAQFTELKSALNTHQAGVLSLIKAKLGAKQKQLTGQIDKAFKLSFAPLGDLEKLKTLVVDATLQACLHDHAPAFMDDSQSVREHIDALIDDETAWLSEHLPFNKTEFDLTKDKLLTEFLLTGQSTLKTLKDIYISWQSARGKLLMLDREIFGESIEDIEDQLDDLSLSDFIYRTDVDHWREYPRYLQALNIRLDRLVHNLDADLDGVYLLDVHMERLANRVHDPKVSDYRWAVEEYRINLFAQPMKTKFAISEKRLEKLWVSLNTK
ncbi:ATP-dependent RNA helicase HrpA [Moraxella haemolytica]|uniref:ATP-dependent RNA helicase HrpA n=1 Tax=Moraxella haemolytica TaxID=2904119 RepID=UPI0025427016|nr:ATP-dependent RNA helicase HrpA [Moraxella sp. ZY171148]WII96118.1 ATP-dependent RNA helicase HrpA [Moraxella sp. ZY171148]